MKKAVVDLTGCTHWYDLHKRFADALEFPDYYGMNLDAFWDCISIDCDVDFVTVIGVKTLSESIQKEAESIWELIIHMFL